MAAFTSIVAAIGLGLSAASVGTQVYSMSQQAKVQKEMASKQREAEAVRQQQMNLESMRRKREMIRQANAASSMAVASATNQGGGESSGLAGALSTVSGRAGVGVLAGNQNQELGGKMFDINSQMATLQGERAGYEGMAGMASGIGSLGGAMIKNSETIGKVGTYLSSKFA